MQQINIKSLMNQQYRPNSTDGPLLKREVRGSCPDPIKSPICCQRLPNSANLKCGRAMA